MRRLLTVVLLAAPAAAQPLATGPAARFDGFRIVSVELRTPADARFMEALGADRWSHGVEAGEAADFMVSPAQLAALDATDLAHQVVIEDVQGLLDAESARLRAGPRGRGWFDDFKDLAAINDYLDALGAGRPDIASVFDLGQSIQGRKVRGIRIANDAFGDPSCKPTILLNACQHAREWITPMVAMYAADRLLALHGVDPGVTSHIDRAEIFIVPVVNPDGYSFTWTNNRLWRKNRRENENGTFGVDLNRNWGYEWGHDEGSSGIPSRDTYRGTAPFSEPETQAIRDLALSRARLAAQVDIHSYGQLILAPWGYTDEEPPGHETFQRLGAELQQVILPVHGKLYEHGPCYSTLYPISGGAGDWFWGDRAAHNFLIELRQGGFIVPPEEIIPTGEEILPALVHFASWARLERKPPADFNDDATITPADVLDFLVAWGAGDASADFSGDGVIDSRDVIAFFDLWAAGC